MNNYSSDICFYKIEHVSFFFSLLDRRPDDGLLLFTRRSSSVSNQSSTAPIKTLTTYFKIQIDYYLENLYL